MKLAKHLNISRLTVGKYLNLGLVYIKCIVLKWTIYRLYWIFVVYFYILTLESELVSGFMTEHAAVIFVFFFLAEYASIVLICILISVLFLGGYILDLMPLFPLVQYLDFDYYIVVVNSDNIEDTMLTYSLVEGLIYGLTLGLKSSIMIFVFIWVRASFPRIRFDQLMSFCWTILLPLVIAFIILIPCILYSFDFVSANIYLL